VLRGVFAGGFAVLLLWWAVAAMFSGSGDSGGPDGKGPNGPNVKTGPWLDRLDRSRIKPEQRFADQPKELVAVLGDPRGQNWLPAGGMGASIQGVRYGSDGRLIATTASTGEVRLWDAASLREVAVLRGESGFNNAAAFIDSDYFVASNSTGLVSVWEAGPGREGTLKMRYRVPRTFASLSANGRVAAGVVWDQERMQARGLVTWNVLEGVPNARDIVELPAGRGHFVSVSPTGKHLAIRYDPGNGGFMNSSLLIWDVMGKRAVATLSGVRMATAFGFSPDGKQLGLASQQQA
jgi:WD40 repeat protein